MVVGSLMWGCETDEGLKGTSLLRRLKRLVVQDPGDSRSRLFFPEMNKQMNYKNHFHKCKKQTNILLFTSNLVRVFSDVLVAFLYFDICHYLVANIKILKSHLNIREGSDYLEPCFKCPC